MADILDASTVMFLTFFFASMLRSATPILFTALGETYVESAGIFNLGTEGMMISAAYTGFVAAVYTGSTPVGLLVGIVTGMIVGLLFGVFVITLGADQTVTGIAFSFVAVGFTSLAFRIMFGTSQLPTLPAKESINIPTLSSIPIIGKALFNQPVLVYLAIALVPLFYYVLHRTRFGLKLRTLGEDPMVADTAGVNVSLFRYVALILGGAMAGLGGTYLSLYQISIFQDNMTQGRGWIAIAIVMFARWNPLVVFLGSLLYGGAESLAGGIQALGFLRTMPSEAVLMLPYLVTLLGLVALGRRARFPPALGRPYRRGE